MSSVTVILSFHAIVKIFRPEYCHLYYYYYYCFQLRTAAFNPLNAELISICHLLALLRVHHIFHVSGLRVKGLKNERKRGMQHK